MTRFQLFSTRLFLLSMVLAVTGCITIPAPLEGDYSDFYPEQAIDRSIGAQVRWGGAIVNTAPQQNQTCIEVLSKALGSNYRPETTDRSHGRFLACRPVFLDPEVFVNGREVTVVGRFGGFEQGSVGEFTYNYPRVDAETIYLWPEYVAVNPVYYSRFYWGWPYYRYSSRWYFNYAYRPYYFPRYHRSPPRRHGTAHESADSVQRATGNQNQMKEPKQK